MILKIPLSGRLKPQLERDDWRYKMALGCQVNYSTIHFGTVCVGAYDDELFKITNTGDPGDGNISGTVSVPGSDYSIQGTATYDLAPGEEQWFTVRFEPQSAGLKEQTVETGDALCANLDVDGTGNDTAVCAVNLSSLSFGEVAVGSTSDLTFRITNTGCGTVAGTVSIATGSTHWSVQGEDDYSLTGGQYQDFTIRFAPLSAGTFTGSVETGDAICADITLSGTSNYPRTVPYFKHGTGETEVTVYLRTASEVPYPVEHEVPTTISTTEDRSLRVYEHSLAGSRKRIWTVTAHMNEKDDEGYRWKDLVDFYYDTIHGAREQFTFRDASNRTFTVRMIRFGAPEVVARGWIKIKMLLEEDY
jgi:hypothetical protein